MNIIYPVAASYDEILPDLLAKGKEGRFGFDLFPEVSKETYFVRWGQKDNAFGLMQMRGMDGGPGVVRQLGRQTFVYEPGTYGEFINFTARDILTRANPGNLTTPIPVGEMIGEAQVQLIGRRYDRMEYNIWSLLASGTLNVPLLGPTGVITYTDSYNIQTYTAPIPWSTTATATPIANMQTIQQLQVGHSTSFGADSTMHVNQITGNRLLNNSNVSDFGGRRDQYGATYNNLATMNNYFAGQNLPQIKVVDYGFQPIPLQGPQTNPAVQYQKFIANGVGILIGKRPGNAPVGKFHMTINEMNPSGGGLTTGPYQFIADEFQGINAPKLPGGSLKVHQGFNGGLALEYPYSVVACTLG